MTSTITWYRYIKEIAMPTLDSNSNYASRECLVVIQQRDYLKTTVLTWQRTIIRNKTVERWEWNGKISPWEPLYYAYLPEPPKL